MKIKSYEVKYRANNNYSPLNEKEYFFIRKTVLILWNHQEVHPPHNLNVELEII